MKNLLKSRTFWGIVLSVAFLVISFYRVDLSSVPRELSKISWFLLVPAFLCQFINLFVRSQRWRFIIEPERKSDWLHTFSLYSIGAMVNLTFPPLIGQVARAVLFSKRYKISKTFTLTTIMLEFLFDVISLLFITVVVSMVFVIYQELLTTQFLIILLLILLFVFFNLILGRKRKIRLLDEISKNSLIGRIKARLTKTYDSFLDGLRMLRSTKHLTLVSLASLFSWIFNMLAVFFLILAFKLELPVWSAVVVVFMGTIFTMISLTPGNIGTLHLATVLALGFFGTSRGTSLSVAIIVHLASILPTYVAGAFFLSTEHLTIKELKIEDKQAEAEILRSLKEENHKE